MNLSGSGLIGEDMIKYPCDAKELADKILEECDDICKKMGIEFCLTMGTALGLFRDGKYIQGDNDIDVSVKCSDDKWIEFIKWLQENGYRRDGTSQHFYKNDEILLDVHHYALDFPVSCDKVVTYNGRIYNIPHPFEQYFKTNYGDWRTPKPKNWQNVY